MGHTHTHTHTHMPVHILTSKKLGVCWPKARGCHATSLKTVNYTLEMAAYTEKHKECLKRRYVPAKDNNFFLIVFSLLRAGPVSLTMSSYHAI